MQRPLDIHLTIRQWPGNRRPHPGKRREMHHGIDRVMLQDLLQQVVIADIPLAPHKAFRHPSQGL
jgi:hypothetical protein